MKKKTIAIYVEFVSLNLCKREKLHLTKNSIECCLFVTSISSLSGNTSNKFAFTHIHFNRYIRFTSMHTHTYTFKELT